MSVTPAINPANLHGLDYRAEAARLGPPVVSITDSHTHINGKKAAQLYHEVAMMFGIEKIHSMTHLEDVEAVGGVLGDKLSLIAVPQFNAEDLRKAFTTEWLERIGRFAELGSRICKFWCAPRAKDYAKEFGDPTLMDLDSEWRRRSMDRARDCGMMFMTHIADPDTWFAGKYMDEGFYGTKLGQYEVFERVVYEYEDTLWLAAHMGGYPEDLEFLDGLLGRHDNLYLDTSATKWMVRELSKHSRDDLIVFLRKWAGRIIFGSDIVVQEAHLDEAAGDRSGRDGQANTRNEAFDLYASRYFALRTLWEGEGEGKSPIADPDLHMVDPERYDENSSPVLRGHHLPDDILKYLYHDAAEGMMRRWDGLRG